MRSERDGGDQIVVRPGSPSDYGEQLRDCPGVKPSVSASRCPEVETAGVRGQQQQETEKR
ncbi:Hypothetical protein SMAX5B_013538 [Scophthalmus maximus]|uniref:Uncharacterized protein n=1 Tax=Scophthalmus maximus TaxID=52904 RepID=A0A2U9AWS2_SCOMX|nr:Hypothetical protein SMAX5B_013538 [Scophthalmus maximus]